MRILAIAALLAAVPAAAQHLGRPSPEPNEVGHQLAEHFHVGRTLSFTQLDLEASQQEGSVAIDWEGEGWIGDNLNKFWWKTEGERKGATFERAEVQALYSRNIWSFFDFQAGVRTDFEPDRRGYAVFGIQGLAPGFLETEMHAFIGFKGDISLRLRQSADLRVTNRFVLQPLVEADIALTDVPERRVGSGISRLEGGIQARYEVTRKFAPTLGLIYEGSLGKTAGLAQDVGEGPGGWSLRAGVRFWF